MTDKKEKLIPSSLKMIFLLMLLLFALSLFPCIRNFFASTLLGLSGETINKDFYNILVTFFGIGGLLGNFWVYSRRLKNQEEQLTLQVQANLDQRFGIAIECLGNSGESARTGAIYSLYHLAIEHEKYRQSVMDILCSHIRSTTGKKQYEVDFPIKPSNEIQTLIDLIFKENGIYYKYFPKLNKPNLSNSYLIGANFIKARCPKVLFKNTNLTSANFHKAECLATLFYDTKLFETKFIDAKLIFAKFIASRLHGAKFVGAMLCKSEFVGSKCIGANFSKTNLSLSNFKSTDLSGVQLTFSQLIGATFDSVNINGATTKLSLFRKQIGENDSIDLSIFTKTLDIDEFLRFYNYIIGSNEYNDFFINSISPSSLQLKTLHDKILEFHIYPLASLKEYPNGLNRGKIIEDQYTQAILDGNWEYIEDFDLNDFDLYKKILSKYI
jgi:hypothetical protein